LDGRRTSLGDDDVATMSSRYGFAACLSAQGRTAEAIPLMQKLLSWHREQYGDIDKKTLTIINDLAIDLRDNGNMEESEILFRDLISARQKVLEPGDFDIGRALGGLAKTLEKAGKLEDAATYRQQALAHRLEHEGTDAWWTNRNRLDLAMILQELERFDQSIALLDELQISMAGIEDPDQEDQELLAEAAELRASIQVDGNGEND
jgi:tetratricopeptide (TPR) repeat protein